MFTRPILLLSMCFMLMSASNCSSTLYKAPNFEDCRLLTTWSAQKLTDVGTCFCIDDELSEKTFPILYSRAEAVMKEHPLQLETMAYLTVNKATIIKNGEYELPISYCRGYTTLSPVGRKDITVWAENNRLERIKCELGEQQ